MEWIRSLDYQILSAIAAMRNDLLTAVMVFITHLGDNGTVWLVLAAACLARRKTRLCGAAMLLALLLSLLVGNITIKPLVARPRPFLTYPELVRLIEQGGYSFPSAHAMSSFSAGTAFFLFFRRRGQALFGVPCLLLAAGIAFSRLYVGVHYPSDVLCGAFFGISLAFAAVWLTDWAYRRLSPKNDTQEK